MKDKKLATLKRIMNDIDRRDLIHQIVRDPQLDGRTIACDAGRYVNFGSCSYLGLEHHPALKTGAREALDRFGTQFSSSRVFASLALYEALETRLTRIFEQPVVVSASTTLGHQAALPTIVGDRDAVIVDLQVHTSVQVAVQLLKADGVHVDVIRHNAMRALERKLKAFKGKYDKVWYLADGVYSIFGDSAPFAELQRLLDAYPHFHLYVDDAHGMGWTGAHGRGWARSQMDHHERMVMAVSLNKSFACAGGCLVFPDEEMARLVKSCGGPMIFSGPIQPPMLGAAVAAAELHLSEAIIPLQQRLGALIDYTNETAAALGVPLYDRTRTPLFFVPLGLPKLVFKMVERLKRDGFYTHAGTFPATPIKQSGLRFMLSAQHREEDIAALLARVAFHYPRILGEEATSCAEVARHFDMKPFDLAPAAAPAGGCAPAASQPPPHKPPRLGDGLAVQLARSIDDLDGAEWDGLFCSEGNLTAASLRLMERVFSAGEQPGERCDFYYCLVRDEQRRPVVAAMFTHVLMKDDIFAPAAVSQQIEQARRQAPRYLTSHAITLGTPITKGRHLHVDFHHPQWRPALRQLIAQMEQAMETHGATQMMLRDFVGDEHQELSRALYDLGFTPMDLPEVSRVEPLDWRDRDDYLRRLSARYRSDLRREVLRHEHRFEVITGPVRDEREIRAAYQLYLNVFKRSFELNVFPLPFSFFEQICRHPDYDVLRLYPRTSQCIATNTPADPIAVMFSFVGRNEYTALVVGLDDRFLRSHNSYKQLLFQTVMRARALGCGALDLAFTANAVKKKVGARCVPARAYIQLLDHFNMSVIDNLAGRAA